MEHGARPDSKLASATVNYRGTIRFSCSTRITFFSPPRRGRGGKNRVSRPLFLPVEESVEKERGGEARRAIETEEEPFPKVGKTLRGSLAPPLFLSSPNRSSRVAQWRRKIAIFLSSSSSLFLRAFPSSILFFFFFLPSFLFLFLLDKHKFTDRWKETTFDNVWIFISGNNTNKTAMEYS